MSSYREDGGFARDVRIIVPFVKIVPLLPRYWLFVEKMVYCVGLGRSTGGKVERV